MKYVRACIDAELGELMENEIERHSVHPNDESIVSRIIDRVLASPQLVISFSYKFLIF